MSALVENEFNPATPQQHSFAGDPWWLLVRDSMAGLILNVVIHRRRDLNWTRL